MRRNGVAHQILDGLGCALLAFVCAGGCLVLLFFVVRVIRVAWGSP